MVDSAELSRSTSYVLGHQARELARLESQARLFEDITRDFLIRAGLKPGMRVVDLGCGVGDVSLIAADLVGPNGRTLGVDISADALEMARARAARAGLAQADFVEGRLEAFDAYSGVDAVIGRFILIHLPDPAAALSALFERLEAGTIVAFAELDLTTASATPPLPLLERCIGWIIEVYARTGLREDMGADLFAAFRGAGVRPNMTGLTRIASSADEAGFDFVVESVKSLLPAMEKLAIATPGDVGVDTLKERLLAEASGEEHCIFYPRVVGGWGRAGHAANQEG